MPEVGEEVSKMAKKEREYNYGGPGGAGGGIYGLGFIGAAVYYIQQADTFWEGVVGFLQALVWPAFWIYETLKFMGV